MRLISTWLRRLLDRRNIYIYWDGRNYRRSDPFVIYRGIFDSPICDIDAELPMLTVDDPQARLEASKLIAEMIRDVFAIPSVAAGGLTELECQHLLADFWAFMTRLKKNTPSPPISPPSTEPEPENSATNNDSPSSSCETGKDTEKATPSRKESSGDSTASHSPDTERSATPRIAQ